MKVYLKTLFPVAVALLLTGCPHQGVVCSEGMSACGEICMDLQSSPQSCGACGVSCEVGQICQEGACACAPGAEVCDGACVVTASNPQHCGACGNVCGDNEVCEAGACKVSCSAPGLTQCGQSCVALSTDEANCGACGTVCEQGLSCHEGKCGWDLVAACFTTGQVVGLQAETFVKGPLKSLGTGPQALATWDGVLLSVDGLDQKLYQASLPGLQKLDHEATLGSAANHIVIEKPYAYVVNAISNTLQILQASDAAGLSFTTVGELSFGANSSPQVAAKVGNKLYVTLLGGYGSADAAAAGQKVVEVDVTDPANPTRGVEFDLTTLQLRTFQPDAEHFPRPAGIVAKDGALYVALNHADSFFTVAGPAYVAVIPLDGGAMRAVELPEEKCLNAIWIAAHGDQVIVSCMGRATYDPNTYALSSVEASGLALVKADDTATAVSLGCPSTDASCAPALVGRFGIRGNDVIVGEQNGGRIFVVGVDTGALVEKRTLTGGNAIDVCPAGMFGSANVSDVLSIP